MRWIHIASVVTLIGGFIYARFALAPALASLPTGERELVGSKAVNAFRPLMIAVLIAALGSGCTTTLPRPAIRRPITCGWESSCCWCFTSPRPAILYAVRPSNEAKRNRTALSITISGLVVVAIAAYLRFLSLK